MKLKTKFIAILFVIIILLTGCDNGTEKISNKIDVTSAGWVYKNVDTAWQNLVWSNSSHLSTCFFDFSLAYEGSAIVAGELVSFTAESGSVLFNVPVDKEILFDVPNDSNKHVISGYYMWDVGNNNHFMPLGPWTFTLTFSDGSESVYTQTFPKPGSTEIPAANSYMITENLVADTTHFPMLHRAVNHSATYSSNELTITFATPVNDDQVRSGYIVVYDSTADYIGSSNWFVDNSGAIDANFTGGFNTDGSNNIYTINLSTELSSAITTNGTYYVSVFLVDGKQYGDGRYDCISYSAPKSFIID